MEKITLEQLKNIIKICNDELSNNGIINFHWKLNKACGCQNVNLVCKKNGAVKLSTGYGTRYKVSFYLKNIQIEVIHNAKEYI